MLMIALSLVQLCTRFLAETNAETFHIDVGGKKETITNDLDSTFLV